jgi:hypothetical protein
MKSSDIAKRLAETTSRQFLEEWERGVILELLNQVAEDALRYVLNSKCTAAHHKAGKTKSSDDSTH